MILSLVAALGLHGLAAAPTMNSRFDLLVDMHSVVVDSFMGLGIQWDPYEYMPTPEQRRVVESRVAFCRPGLIRVCVANREYFSGYDVAGKPRYAWTTGSNPQFDQLCEILHFATEKKIPVMLGEWGPPGKVKVGDHEERIEVPDPRWARMFVDLVHQLRDVRGFKAIQLLNYVNEPNGDWSGNKDFESWSTGVRNLAHELEARGIGSAVRIIGPDTTANIGWPEGFGWLDRVATEMPREVGTYDVHWYANDWEVRKGAIEPYLRKVRERCLLLDPSAAKKRFVLGECGLVDGKTNGDQQPRVRSFEYGVMMADFVGQVARSGWVSALAWDLDDAMHINKGPATPIPGPDTLKVWGFWNSWGTAMGKPEEEVPRPWFYTWSLASRLFGNGTRIVKADGLPTEGFRGLAGVDRAGEHLRLMLVNSSDHEATLHVQVPGQGAAPYRVYHYFEKDRPVDGEGLPKAVLDGVSLDLGKGWEVSIPANGVVFLEGF